MGDRTPSPEKSSGGKPRIKWGDPYSKGRASVESLAAITPHLSSATPLPPTSPPKSPPSSSAMNDNLCTWLYETFHSDEPQLHLVVLCFLPILANIYLTCAAYHKPLPDFESILLAIYAHETTAESILDADVNENWMSFWNNSVKGEEKRW